LKKYLSVAAAVAALAFTTSTGFAQTSPTNNVVPGSNGYTGSSPAKSTNKKAITKKQNMALNHVGSKNTNAALPGSPGYSGSSKPAGASSSSMHTSAGLPKTKTNSNVPGSPGFTGSSKPAGT
jgi:hypothetical protein